MSGPVRPDAAPIVGRDHDLEHLLEVVARARHHGPRTIELVAPRGSGLSTMLDALGDRLARQGVETTILRQHPLTGMIGEHPAGRASEPADLSAARIRSHLRRRAQAKPQLLLVDDADALTPRVEALVAGACSIDDADVVVVLARHAAMATPPTDDAGAGMRREVLEPLDARHVETIVQAHLPTEDAARSHDIARSCAGNLWLAIQLAMAGSDAPLAGTDWVTSTYRQLTEQQRDLVLELAALTEPLPAEQGDSLLAEHGCDAADVARLIAIGLVSGDADGMALASPFTGTTLLEHAGAARRRVVHARLSDRFERWGRSDGGTSRDLLAAAQHAQLAGDIERARALARQSSERATTESDLFTDVDARRLLADIADIRDRPDQLRRLVHAARRAGLRALARESVRRLLQAADGAGRADLKAYAFNELYWLDGGDERRSRLEVAAALSPGTHGWAHRAKATLAYLAGDYADAVEHDAVAIDHACEHGDRYLEALALQKQALCLDLAGDPERAGPQYAHAAELAARAGMPRWSIHALLNAAELADSMLDETTAHEALDAAERLLHTESLQHMEWEVAAFQALHLCRRARFDEAERQVTRALSAAAQFDVDDGALAIVTSALGYAVVDRGDERRAASVLDRFERQARNTDDRMLLLEQGIQRARLAIQQDHPDAAVRHATDIEPLDDTTEAARLLVLVDVAARFEHAAAAASAAQVAARLRTSRIRIAQVACQAERVLRLPDARDRAVGWDTVADTCARGSRRVDELRLRVSALLSDPDRFGRDLEPLRTIERGCRRAGMRPEADLVARELQRRGGVGSYASSRLDGVLTDREREIVDLIAAGLDNHAIAARLGIKPSSVTRRLSNAYRRTGTSSRIELLRWIEHRSAPPGS